MVTLTALDYQRLITLTSIVQTHVYLAAKKFSPIFVPQSTILADANVPQRSGELALASFCKKGWFEKKTNPRQRGSWVDVRYVGGADVRSPEIARQRSPEIARQRSPEIARQRSPEIARQPSAPYVARASDPDPELSLKPVRPSVCAAPERTDGRTEFFEKVAVEWVIDVGSAQEIVERLLASFSLADVAAYLDDAWAYLHSGERRPRGLAFSGLEAAQYPLGAACTAKRITAWLAWRAEHARPKVSALLELVCQGCEHTISLERAKVPREAKRVKCPHCGERTPLVFDTDEAALAALVQRAGR